MGATSRPTGRLFPENSCFLGNGCRVREVPVGVVERFCPARPNGGVRELVTWCDLGTGGYPSQWCGWVFSENSGL